MSTPLDEDALDFLDGDAKRLVKAMLKAVVEHPDIYSNGFSVTRRGDSRFEYFLGGHGQPGPFANPQHLNSNITDTLVFHGIAGAKVNPQWPDSFRSFTEAAMEWHRTFGGLSPDEVRSKIGQILYRRHDERGPTYYRPEEVAREIGVEPTRVRRETILLLDAGLVERRYGDGTEFGALYLTRPLGIRWAAGGFRPIGTIDTAVVNLELHVEIHNVIEQARAAELPEDLLLQFEARLRRVQEELEKPRGQGRFERVRELMEFAANTKEVALLTSGFVAGNAEKMRNLVDAAVGVIP